MSVHDLWNGARTGTGRRWEVRWRANGKQHKQRYASKAAADKAEASRKLDPNTPERRSTLTVREMCATWLSTVSVRPSTRRAYELEVAHIEAAFGERLASQVKPSEIRTWLARPQPGVSIRRRCLVTLRRAYKLAIVDRTVLVDPTLGAKPPREEKADPQFLTWAALAHLASRAGQDAPLIWLLGTGGFRLSEAVALDQSDIDRARGRVRVRKSKTDAGVREVPIDADILDMLSTAPGPVFRGQNGGRLNAHNWRERRFRQIAEDAGLSSAFTPHKLRHTAASLAIHAHADAKTVALMLGHSNPAVTLRIYQHLFDSQLDDLARRMGEARRAALGIAQAAPDGRIGLREGAEPTLSEHISIPLGISA